MTRGKPRPTPNMFEASPVHPGRPRQRCTRRAATAANPRAA
ncbi:hypothetical protein HMPREF0970_00525 [Schaalia odontolytica F0309]|uniref:Uncharacterized protein n=1 Tax=Schaalia odontolytica F0309 TaxID=649742 RepID=D4TX68_9ACTO|nr:hypothetical protein HMPREF0970_00525 [Schaalia odontolytica F0309]